MSKDRAKDRTTWIRIFTVSNPQEHPGGYTVYRVVHTSFPTSSPDQATTLSCWKRWSQIKALHKSLETIHKSLYLAGDFPKLPKSTYFNRKDAKVIEERQAAAQELLEFSASFPALYLSSFFQDFFKAESNNLEVDTNSESSHGQANSPDTQSLSSMLSSELTVSVAHDLSIDSTPVLTPVSAPSSLSPSTLPPSCTADQQGTTEKSEVPNPEDLPTTKSESKEQERPASLDIGGGNSTVTLTPQKSPGSVASPEYGLASYEDKDGGIPSYITEAAAIIAEALSLEADEDYEASIASYRSAIGKLLSCVQSDPDANRQAAVKKRVAQYISKAEQLVQRELETKTRKSSRKVSSIPHLQLFGQLAELRKYKVIDIFDKKIILAQHLETGSNVIFKVLQKSAAVFKKSKTSLLPINITYMVGLLKYFETDEAVYLMLEYCPAGKLWDVVRPLVEQQLSTITDQSRVETSAKPALLKPSDSFIIQRKESVRINEEGVRPNTEELDDPEVRVSVSDTDSDVGDMSMVYAESNSLLVVSDDQIDHYQCEDELREAEMRSGGERLISTSKEILRSLEVDESSEPDIIRQLSGLQEKVQGHISGNIDVSDIDLDDVTDHDLQHTGRKKANNSESDDKSVFFMPEEEKTLENPGNDGDSVQKEEPRRERPRFLRKLSEVLPQFHDPELPDYTFLPDRVVRLWAAELAQVLSSLHYRDIIIKDLNPDNLLLDSTGHIKLTYQCEWVSIERELSRKAIQGNFTAPEVLTVSDVTPAADWWSFGAILLLLYTGSGPSSLIPTGLDSTIPLAFPPSMDPQSTHFLASLLEVYPANRLGAGSTGSLDIRNHPYFKNFDWNKMAFLDS